MDETRSLGRKNSFWIFGIDNRSLWLDLKILWLTIKMVLVRNGIIAQGYATMPKFTGSETKLTDAYR
jgi:hypothetical protein